MPKFWNPILFAAFLVLFTGCPTPKKAPQRLTPLGGYPALTNQAQSVTGSEPARPAPRDSATGVKAGLRFPEAPRDPWVSWAEWSQFNGHGALQRVSAAPMAFTLGGPQGTLGITVGSRVAFWNGMHLELGFIPRFTNGVPMVHALDVMKNFEPLFARSSLPRRNHRIVVIDPGHGGENTGAKSVFNQRFEKEYTLEWALRTAPLLASRGWKVYLTRTNDVDLTLPDRVAFAERLQADLFLSFHFNAAGPNGARPDHGGIETYCLTPAGMPSNLVRDFEDDPAQVFPNNAFDVQNLQYAVRLHAAMLEQTQGKDKGIRRARFMGVLRGQNRPAVLLEAGYLSDAKEARLIATASYRQKLAEAVALALTD